MARAAIRPEILERILSGQIAPDEIERYADELEGSDWFADLATDIGPKDELIRLVRGQRSADNDASDPRLETLMTRLRSLGSSSPPVKPGDSTFVQNAAPSTPYGTFVQAVTGPATAPYIANVRISFLSPPQTSDEMGRLNGYRILKLLGEGGMGMVFLAEDVKLKRKLALKVIKPEIAAVEEHRLRFLREAQIAASVEHDHVIPIFRVDEENGVPYIAMPFLKGEPLDERLKRVPQPPIQDVIRIGRQVAAGLSVAHEAGLIHRDIKPANIWLEAPNDRVKILDFGLARATGADLNLTQSGVMMGTPAYMAPEQARGATLDGRADLFSLGITLYVMATGTKPFTGGDVMSLLTALAVDHPPSPEVINPTVPPALAQLIMQLLEKSPQKRPQTAKEVSDCLRLMEENPTLASVSLPEVKPSLPTVAGDPWVGIDDDTEAIPMAKPVAARAVAKPAKSPPPSGFNKKWLVGGLGGALVLLIGFIIIKITSKDGTVTEIHVPEGSKIEIAEGDPKVAEPKPKSPPNPLEPDPVRKAARRILAVGGTLRLSGGKPVAKLADLPEGALSVEDATLHNLGDGKVTSEDFAALADLPGLKFCTLFNSGIRGEWLVHLRCQKELGYLNLDANPLGDAGLPHLAGLTALQRLGLQDCRVTDAGLVHLKGLSRLEFLSLSSNRVTDAGLAQLAGLTGIRELWMAGCPITDEGLKGLQKWAGLRHLRLNGTKVTTKGVEAFRAAVPGCKIEWDGGVIDDGDPERQVAERIYTLGGKVQVLGKDGYIDKLAQLPPDRIKIGRVAFLSRKLTAEQLAPLTVCESLIELDLGYGGGDGSEVAPLAKLPNLKIVSFHRCPVTDDGMAAIGGLAALERCTFHESKLTDAGTVHFKRLTKLRWLSLSGTGVTDAGLQNLEGCIHLRNLELKKLPKVTALGVERLHAALPGCEIDWDGGIVKSERHVAERVLALGGTVSVNGEPRQIKTPAELPRGTFALTAVNLHDNRGATEELVATLKNCPNLIGLDLVGTPAQDAWLVHLKGLTKLQRLGLGSTGITDAGLAHVTGLKNLQYLNFTSTRVTDAGLVHLKAMTDLTDLLAINTTLTGDGLIHLKALPKLRFIEFGRTKIAEANLAHFKDFPALRSLHLYWIPLSEAGVAQLSGLKEIETLNLAWCGVTETGLVRLAGLTNVREMYLGGSTTTDAGLKQLYGLKKLRFLNLEKVNVSAEAVAALRKALPDCQVHWVPEPSAKK